MRFLLVAVAALSGIVGAGATPAPMSAPGPDHTSHPVEKRADACTFTGENGAAQAMQAKGSCSTIVLSGLTVPANTTLDMTKLNDGTTIVFQGRTTFGYAEWEGPLFSVSGNKITVRGDPGSVLDGQGALWWDGLGGNGGKTKPKFFQANRLNDSTLEAISILNAPKQVFSLNRVNNLVVRDVTVDNSAGDVDKGGHNTDAFDIGNADGVLITGARVWNQDDCVAVNSGRNILFTNGFCSGGHGLSIGSVGGRDNNDVSNVTFSDTVMAKSQQSVRIKTISGASGSVTDITYRNITMSGGTDYGIIVDQSYNGVKGQPTNGIKIERFKLEDVKGTVEKGATNVLVQCGQGSCSDWSWSGVSVTGGEKKKDCMNLPDGVTC